ncbi:NH4 transporter [Amphidinium carterae]
MTATLTVAEHLAAHDECLDTVWMLLAAMLVFFMHAGFSLLETGCVQFKNAQNILAKNLVVVTCGFLCWYFVGWALAFGPPDDPNEFVGSVGWAMDGFFDDPTLFRQWFFQGAFCATASTIVSGAIAERTKLTAFIIFIIFMTSIIYPVVIYWGWSGYGFLSKEDGTSAFGDPAYMDFAGSGLVHMVGGVAALFASIIVGPRKGRWDAGNEDAFLPHNVPFCVIGTFFLWFGWYGFNPGSTLQMHELGDAHSAGLVAANTTLAPCVGGLVVFMLRRFLVAPKALDVPGFCNGLLAGLVGITAGCGTVKCWEAIIIGGVAGFVYQGWSMLMQKLKIDDVVDAVAVHGACGVWGVVALGLFGDPDEGNGGNGAFYGGDQLATQCGAIVVIFLWTAICTSAVFVPLRLIGMLRLSDEFQEIGADAKEHSPAKGYTLSTTEQSSKL